jgi:hypothetical protein
MAVKTKPRYRGTPYATVKYNPINTREGWSSKDDPNYYGTPKPWWKFWK